MNLIIFSCLSYINLLVFFCELSMSFFYFSIGLLILCTSILKPSLCIMEITFCLYKCCEYVIEFCQLSSDFVYGILGFLYTPTLTSIHDYGKKIKALTRQTLVDKVMSQLFNMLSRFVIAFLPRSKSLLISWLQSPSAVILEPKKIKSVAVFIVSPSICHEVMELDAMIFVFRMLSFKSFSKC